MTFSDENEKHVGAARLWDTDVAIDIAVHKATDRAIELSIGRVRLIHKYRQNYRKSYRNFCRKTYTETEL